MCGGGTKELIHVCNTCVWGRDQGINTRVWGRDQGINTCVWGRDQGINTCVGGRDQGNNLNNTSVLFILLQLMSAEE